MKTKSLCQLNIEELNAKLLTIMRKQFNLRMQAASGQLKQTHLLRQMRRDIARIKTIITKNMSGL